MKFGKWNRINIEGKWAYCICECGTERKVVNADLESGRSKSCGCTRSSHLRKMGKEKNTTHGMSKTPEFKIWIDMRRRCTNPDRHDYANYGGRGITVCKEWLDSFENFYADMGNKPKNRFLERRDNNGPYSKENCYWADRKTQARNTRTNRFFFFRGKKRSLVEVAEILNISPATISSRLYRGWSEERALSEPVQYKHSSR